MMTETRPFEARLHAFRRTQDGTVVSFLLHPNDVPAHLATNPLGTRYALAAVEITDDNEDALAPPQNPVATTAMSLAASPPEPVAKGIRDSGGRDWSEVPPSQQAGILCSDPAFQDWLGVERWRPGVNPQLAADDAAQRLRARVRVSSRADLGRDDAAAERWHRLQREFFARHDAASQERAYARG